MFGERLACKKETDIRLWGRRVKGLYDRRQQAAGKMRLHSGDCCVDTPAG